MKKGCWIGLAICGVFVLLCMVGGFLLLRGAVKFMSKLSFSPYSLQVDGDRLYVQSMMSNTSFDVVSGKPSACKIELSPNEQMEMTIDDGMGVVTEKAPSIFDQYWSEQNQAAYWVSYKENKGYTLRRWSRKDGFRTLIDSQDRIGNPHESIDGKFLCVETSSNDGNIGSDRLVVFSVKDFSKKTYKIDEDYYNATMVSEGKFLLFGDEIYLWQPDQKKKSTLEFGGEIEQGKIFKGRVWAVRSAGDANDVIRLDPTLMKIDQTIPFPRTFLDAEMAEREKLAP